MTAVERYRVASIRYGDQLMTQGLYCDAELQYRNALTIRPDPAAESAAAQAAEYCANPPNQEVPEETAPPSEIIPTPPDAGETPVETPAETPTNG